MNAARPRLVVFSSLFPHPGQPQAGVFIRERMFRVGERLPIVVVAPVPWFPLQGLIRRLRPHFRPVAPAREVQQGVVVYHPRFFCVPGLLKSWDGFFMALGSLALLKRLRREFDFDVIDAHFGYPDGYAATLLGRRLGVPVTITLRGTEPRHSRSAALRPKLTRALRRAQRIFTVSDSLRRLALELGIGADKLQVVGNGVDVARFHSVPRHEACAALGLPADAKVLITVGGLVERKGFHRVIELLPALRRRHPDLHYLIVGGASAEGDWGARLRQQVTELGLADCVHFLGVVTPDALKGPLSAADVFVLATRNEGWANVLLEAMACGLPVVTTDVGGNAEVVNDRALGTVVPFGEPAALAEALAEALVKDWDRDYIRGYAEKNSWDSRVAALVETFTALHATADRQGARLGALGRTTE